MIGPSDETSWDDEPTLGRRALEATAPLEVRPPQPVLLVESGHALGRYLTLPPPPCEVRVGRGRDADCRVRDRSVSRAHILLRIMDDGRVELRDLDSLNGTWINGRRLRGADQVFDGDRIRLGELDLRIAWMSERDLAYQDRIARQVRLAERDALTGLHNRNFLLERLPALLATHRSNGRRLCLVALDVDRFKSVNDTWGHAAGDGILATIARTLAQGVRPEDQAVRAGGEEFWLLLPDTGAKRAARVADRLRLDILREDYSEFVPGSWSVTVSAGIAELGEHESAEEWMHRADTALYEAKRAGRNRVAVADAAGDAKITGGAPAEPPTDPFRVDGRDLARSDAAVTQNVEPLDLSLSSDSFDSMEDDSVSVTEVDVR